MTQLNGPTTLPVALKLEHRLVSDLRASYLNRLPLFRRAALARSPTQFEFDVLRTLCSTARVKAIRATARSTEQAPCLPENYHDLLKAGCSLCAQGVEESFPEVKRLRNELSKALGVRSVTYSRFYWSSRPSGFPLHFDSKNVVNIHLVGEKRWRVSLRPGCASPRRDVWATDLVSQNGAVDNIQAPCESEFSTYRLTPGDVLFIPAGVWHETHAEGVSLGLSVVMPRMSLAELAVSLLLQSPRIRGAATGDDCSLPTDSSLRRALSLLSEAIEGLARSHGG